MKAEEFWREDRLGHANAAVRRALAVGIPAGNWYNLQRTIEAEHAARKVSRRMRTEESLILETDPDRWASYWSRLVSTVSNAFHTVTDALGARWAKPVLITLIPEDDWMEFMHSRYGYYSHRAESHKICLPPSAVSHIQVLHRAASHEITHAAVNQLAGENVPRWLNEGLAVTLEGTDSRPFSNSTRLRFAEISAGFESFRVEVGGDRSQQCYTQSAAIVRTMIGSGGIETIRKYLVEIGKGLNPERAFQAAFGRPIARAERDWLGGN
jgi:hypothetical protein